MNQVIETILSRRSVRVFDENKTVEPAILCELLECALYAPTGMNRQPWHFTLLENQELMAEMSGILKGMLLASGVERLIKRASAPNYSVFYRAPAVFIISSDGSDFGPADCANAAENICIGAASYGLGSCYIAAFRRLTDSREGPRFIKRLGIPEGFKPLYSVAVGYPLETPEAPERKRDVINIVR